MRSRTLRLVALTAATLAVAAVPTLAQFQRPKATVVPVSEFDAVAPRSSARLAAVVTLPAELHVQSNVPSDASLIATVLTIDAPAGVTVGEVVYPASAKLAQQGMDQPLSVFGHDFVIGVVVSIGADVPVGGTLTIPGRLRYQACNDTMCFAPATVETTWNLKVVADASLLGPPQHADVFGSIVFGKGAQPSRTATATPAPSIALPAAPGPEATTAVARPGETPAPPESAAPLLDDQNVLKQLDDFELVSSTAGYMDAATFLRFLHEVEGGVVTRGPFEGKGPLAILLIVFIGGLALNLTPCVLPMIPINLAIIGAGAQAGSRSRGLLLGSVYGAAMALVYGVLGLIVILTAGTFGTINASPWFNAVIAVVFVVLALAMFDVIPIDFSRLSSGVSTTKSPRGSLALAFSMGAISALLAGACVAPVVIQVVLFASNLYATGTTVALALPFVLGLGMALPWPLAGAGIAALPKPGAWMVRVKQVFGVLILGTAIYYGYLAFTLFADCRVDPAAVQTAVAEHIKEGWHASLAEGLAVAAREQKPVFVDLWATWCKNCLTMDKTTFRDEGVKTSLEKYVKVKFQAEHPDDELTSAVMRRFGARGLPTYVVLRPKATASNR